MMDEQLKTPEYLTLEMKTQLKHTSSSIHPTVQVECPLVLHEVCGNGHGKQLTPGNFY